MGKEDNEGMSRNEAPTAAAAADRPDPQNGEPHQGEPEQVKASSDPWCDENHPRMVNFDSISAAAFRIKSGIVRTPCDRSHMSDGHGMEIFFKKDFMQYTGSFKERGARFALMMLDKEQRSRGVIAASAGNHALAMAYHGSQLGIEVTVVMPTVAPLMKVGNCKKLGATVIISGQNVSEARDRALKIAKKKGLTYINGFDHPHILAGQGTMGLEIFEQVPDLDAAIIPVGGGGLIAGCAVALKTMKPEVIIVGVEPERSPGFITALKAGKPVHTASQPSLADGLVVPVVGVNALATSAPYIDKMVTVSEESIAIAILRLIEMEKAVVEGAGAAGIAAVLSGMVPELEGKKVVIPLCGGNIDTTILGRCLERGLAADGRLVKFSVTVSDRPGGIADLAACLKDIGVSIKDMMHERAWIKSDIFSVDVMVVVETRDAAHARKMREVLMSKYSVTSFTGVGSSLGYEEEKLDTLLEDEEVDEDDDEEVLRKFSTTIASRKRPSMHHMIHTIIPTTEFNTAK